MNAARLQRKSVHSRRHNKYAAVGGSGVKPLCPCGKENCPNPGVREIKRPVKGTATSAMPKRSGPRFKGVA